jgi:hypothetical protein
MALPKIHSYTWSDTEEGGDANSADPQDALHGPLGLEDKELHLWVTYPKNGKKKTKRTTGKSQRSKRRLWAVVIIEALTKLDEFTYEITLKRIYKRDERIIKAWVRNDPADQSEDATVFGVISPRMESLDALELQLSMKVAKRVYHAIAEKWSEVCS